MLGGVDLVCFLNRSVVEPQNDVAVVAVLVVKVWSSDGDRLICVVSEYCKRAGRIETDTTDSA